MKKTTKTILRTSSFVFLFLVAGTTFAQLKGFNYLEPLPGLELSETCKNDTSAVGCDLLGDYIESAFDLTVGIAAALAFIMISYGGMLYATSDAIGGKTDGKGYIENAIYGLLLVMSAWIILNTINPKMINFNMSITGIASTKGSIVVASCPECVSLDNQNPKIPTKATGMKVHPSIAGQLVSLTKDLDSRGLSWQVTEAYPPTVVHRDTCHQNASCVDANISNPSPDNIRAFLDAANNRAKLFAQYEVKTQQEFDTLMKTGKFRSLEILVVPEITAPHFSVYKSRK